MPAPATPLPAMPATAQRSIGRLLYLSLILATIAAGLLCRFGYIGLPQA